LGLFTRSLVLCFLTLTFSDPDYTGSLILLLENTGSKPLELRSGESYVQLIAVRYFCGPVLGARDFSFRTDRGCGGFGSTDIRESVERLFADHLQPSAVVYGPSPDPEGDVVSEA
jgi:dUTPase